MRSIEGGWRNEVVVVVVRVSKSKVRRREAVGGGLLRQTAAPLLARGRESVCLRNCTAALLLS